MSTVQDKEESRDKPDRQGSMFMQTPLRVTFRHLEPSAAVESRIREHVDKLERFFGRMIRCRVVVEAPAAHQRKGARD